MNTQPLDFSILKQAEDFKLVELKLKEIDQLSPEVWMLNLQDINGEKSINVVADIGQLTYILFGLSKTVKLSLSPSIYQLIASLCKYNKIKMKSVIIDHVEENMSKSKLEIEDEDRFVYFDISTGDAIALAYINNIPIYVIDSLLDDNTENMIEIDLE